MLGRIFKNAVKKSQNARALNSMAKMGFRTTPVLNKKLSIGETAVVLEDKIAGISQVVSRYSWIWLIRYRTISKSLVLLFPLVMVLQESSVSAKCRQVKWLSSPLASRVWLSISKPTMWVLSSSEKTETSRKECSLREPVIFSPFRSLSRSKCLEEYWILSVTQLTELVPSSLTTRQE